MNVRDSLRMVGANLRGVWAQGMVAPAHRQLRDAIERLNDVSDTIIAEAGDARAMALDELADER